MDEHTSPAKVRDNPPYAFEAKQTSIRINNELNLPSEQDEQTQIVLQQFSKTPLLTNITKLKEEVKVLKKQTPSKEVLKKLMMTLYAGDLDVDDLSGIFHDKDEEKRSLKYIA